MHGKVLFIAQNKVSSDFAYPLGRDVRKPEVRRLLCDRLLGDGLLCGRPRAGASSAG